MKSVIIIKLKDLDIPEFSRDDGKVIRGLIEQLWSQCDEILLDFQDVEFLGISFIDEFYAKLFLSRSKEQILSKVKFLNLDEDYYSQMQSLASARLKDKNRINEHSN